MNSLKKLLIISLIPLSLSGCSENYYYLEGKYIIEKDSVKFNSDNQNMIVYLSTGGSKAYAYKIEDKKLKVTSYVNRPSNKKTNGLAKNQRLAIGQKEFDSYVYSIDSIKNLTNNIIN